MPATLRLTFAFGDLDRARPLIDGSIKPEGIELNPIILPPPERHDRMTRNLEFDACEYSLATYIPARERGLPITAIPVFPHRKFRQESIFIREKADLRESKDLAGRHIGVAHYTNSSGVWSRGILTHDYGVDLTGCTWITEREDEVPHWEPPPGIRVEFRPRERLVDLFDRGDLDVLLYPALPAPVARSKPGLRRLFTDYVEEEKDYYRRTGIFPIMHTVAIKDEVLEKHPWIALSLTKAWAEAKRKMHAYLPSQSSSLIWYAKYWQEQQAVFGDPWIYGVEPNRRTIEQLIDFELEQGIIKKRPEIEGLFAPTTADWSDYPATNA